MHYLSFDEEAGGHNLSILYHCIYIFLKAQGNTTYHVILCIRLYFGGRFKGARDNLILTYLVLLI